MATVSSRSLFLTGLLSLGMLATALGGACTPEPGHQDDMGNMGFALTIASGATLSSASYTITGPGGFTRTGTIDVSHSTKISATVGTLPAGTGYTVAVSAAATDGTTACAGSAPFAIVAGQTTNVTVNLTCHESARTGSVSINGTINICPTIDGVSALPGDAIVGYPIALGVAAHDSDAMPSALAYHWTTSSGALSNPDVANPTFTCVVPGTVTLNVAASDGDPAATCAAAASVTVTCAPASPKTYAWVVLGSGGQASARVATPDPVCPAITVNGATVPMTLRAPAATIPLRTTASAAADSVPSAFPVTACEYPLPAGTTSAIVAGRALPLPKASLQRIVVIGDTGCRLKKGNPWQACSDSDQWPFKQISDAAAAVAPDVVLHVGDYHYRENACPSDVPGCQGSPWGYGWDTWEADLFKPAASLMAAAPWIMVRGNHEECARGGQGWFRFLDTLPFSEARSCNDPANDTVANYNDPYAVPLGADAQVIVFDSAKAGAAALNPMSATDGPIFTRYQMQFQQVATLANRPGVNSFFSNHHPILGYAPVAGANPAGGLLSLLSVMGATFPTAYYPPGIKLALHGHVHLFEAIDFSSGHPTTVVSGNGGDNLDLNLPDPFPVGPASSGGVEPAAGAVVDRIAHTSTFGFMVMQRNGAAWSLIAYTRAGNVLTTCDLDAAFKLSCSNYGFLHLP